VDEAERRVLDDVARQVVELLGGERGTEGGVWGDAGEGDLVPGLRLDGRPVAPPTDPAVRRLLPDGSHDEEQAAEFRRLTEDDLRATKVTNLARLRAALAGPRAEVVVAPDDAPAVAAALADLRLVVAERLGVRDEEDADAVVELVVGGPRSSTVPARWFLASVSVMLGVLQDSLVGLMLGDLPDEPSRVG